MERFTLDIGDIAEMASQVAINGAIRFYDGVGDEMFEYIVSVAVLVVELYPNG